MIKLLIIISIDALLQYSNLSYVSLYLYAKFSLTYSVSTECPVYHYFLIYSMLKNNDSLLNKPIHIH